MAATIEELQKANRSLQQVNKALSSRNEVLSQENELLTRKNIFLLHDNEVLKKDNRALQRLTANLHHGGYLYQTAEEVSPQTNSNIVQKEENTINKELKEEDTIYVASQEEDFINKESDEEEWDETFFLDPAERFRYTTDRVEVAQKEDAMCKSKEEIEWLQKILQDQRDLTQDIVGKYFDMEDMLRKEIDKTNMLKGNEKVLSQQYTEELLGLTEMNDVLRTTIKDPEEQCRRERFLKYEAMDLNNFESESDKEDQRENKRDSPQAAECGENKPKKPSRWKRFIRFFTRSRKGK